MDISATELLQMIGEREAEIFALKRKVAELEGILQRERSNQELQPGDIAHSRDVDEVGGQRFRDSSDEHQRLESRSGISPLSGRSAGRQVEEFPQPTGKR